MSNENVLLFLYEKLFPTVSAIPTQVSLSHGPSQGQYNSNSNINLIGVASASSLPKQDSAYQDHHEARNLLNYRSAISFGGTKGSRLYNHGTVGTTGSTTQMGFAPGGVPSNAAIK